MLALDLWRDERPHALFNDFLDDLAGFQKKEKLSAFFPCDVVERENSYSILFDMPGVKESDIEIELEGQVLQVKAERNFVKEEESSYKSHLIERRHGLYQRSFTLPKSADVNHMEAKFKDGVLALEIPKLEDAKPKKRKIEISDRRSSKLTKVSESNES